MGTTITKSEREALDELFLAMEKRRNFLTKLQDSRKEMIKLFKTLIIKQKTSKQY